ncbi:hypothetical protein F2P81_001965 [Scophthalmus maximus]|uniref:40S ribosomal protein S27 n=1 Tax=Scophthalmus maximus TaxID=52904 RepID=A0A6A4TCU6_SCOMX|nr:hypothetical protein F2P81_001965 [Scophthalmus maximus]
MINIERCDDGRNMAKHVYNEAEHAVPCRYYTDSPRLQIRLLEIIIPTARLSDGFRFILTNFLILAKDLLHPSLEEEKRTHKKKRLVQCPNSYFMDVKCPGCYKITTVFSHAQTVVLCVGCSTVLCQPTGGKARLTEGCLLRQTVTLAVVTEIHRHRSISTQSTASTNKTCRFIDKLISPDFVEHDNGQIDSSVCFDSKQ